MFLAHLSQRCASGVWSASLVKQSEQEVIGSALAMW